MRDGDWRESFARRAVAEGLTDAVYDLVATPVGELLVASGERGVCRVAFADRPDEGTDAVLDELAATFGGRIVRSRAALAEVSRALVDYLEGRSARLGVAVDLRLARAPFRRTVLEELGRVPRGQVVTYAELAARAGRPRAVRAAGTACATNPVPIIVPCHRVVPSSGGVGNYGGGPERKRFLLRLEGALG